MTTAPFVVGGIALVASCGASRMPGGSTLPSTTLGASTLPSTTVGGPQRYQVDTIVGTLANQLGLRVFGSGIDDLHDRLDVTVLVADIPSQHALDRRFGRAPSR